MALLAERSSATSALIIKAKKFVKKVTRHPFLFLTHQLQERLEHDSKERWNLLLV